MTGLSCLPPVLQVHYEEKNVCVSNLTSSSRKRASTISIEVKNTATKYIDECIWDHDREGYHNECIVEPREYKFGSLVAKHVAILYSRLENVGMGGEYDREHTCTITNTSLLYTFTSHG